MPFTIWNTRNMEYIWETFQLGNQLGRSSLDFFDIDFIPSGSRVPDGIAIFQMRTDHIVVNSPGMRDALIVQHAGGNR